MSLAVSHRPSLRHRAADVAGVALSVACLVHCLALPLALVLAPALSTWLDLSGEVHAAILMLALPAALVAMVGGWRRHRRPMPALLAATGLTLLALGLAAHETWLPVADPEIADRFFSGAGALLLAGAHLINWRRGGHPATHD